MIEPRPDRLGPAGIELAEGEDRPAKELMRRRDPQVLRLTDFTHPSVAGEERCVFALGAPRRDPTREKRAKIDDGDPHCGILPTKIILASGLAMAMMSSDTKRS